MSNKQKVNLTEALQGKAKQVPPPKKASVEPEPVKKKTTTKVASSRVGKRNISGYFPPDVHKQLRIIAAEEDITIEEALGNALNTYFERKGRPPIA